MKKRLTEALPKSYVKKPPKKRTNIFDTEASGLHARISPKGSISLAVQYRAGDKVMKATLGPSNSGF